MAGTLTIDFEPVRNALWDWLNVSINRNGFDAINQVPTTFPENDSNAVPIFRAETNYTRPNRSFVEYKFLTSLLALGLKDELLYDEPQDKFYLRGHREFVVQVTAIGEKSQECIAQIQANLSNPFAQEILGAACLSVREQNTINDATVFQEEDHEERSILDVRFGLLLENYDIVEGLPPIDNVQLKNKIVDPAASGAFTVTISKP